MVCWVFFYGLLLNNAWNSSGRFVSKCFVKIHSLLWVFVFCIQFHQNVLLGLGHWALKISDVGGIILHGSTLHHICIVTWTSANLIVCWSRFDLRLSREITQTSVCPLLLRACTLCGCKIEFKATAVLAEIQMEKALGLK